MRKIFCSKLLLLLTVPSAASLAQTQSQQGFENGLRRAVSIGGQPVARFSIADRMAHYKVPGVSVAIMDNCQIVRAQAFGTAGDGKPVGVETVFQAASISKPVAALGALRMVEQGKLDLDADVGTALKSWQVPVSPLVKDRAVTLRGLLSHGAGLGVHGFGGYSAGAPVPSVVQVLDGSPPANSPAVKVELVPGSKWKYSGGGYTVAQLMMTDVSGKPFPALMKDLVFDPLGMTNSSFEQPISPTRVLDAAHAYRGDGSAVPGKWHTYPEMAAAGLWTTPTDLLKLAMAVARSERGAPGSILSQNMAREMLATQIGSFGLGFQLGAPGKPRQFSHGGANEGFRATLLAFPESCQGAAVMTNSDSGAPLAAEVLRAIADAYQWPDPMTSPERETVPLTPAIAERFIGTYHLKDMPGYKFRVTPGKDGSLTMILAGGASDHVVAGSATSLFSPDSGILFEKASTGDKDYQLFIGGTVNGVIKDGK